MGVTNFSVVLDNPSGIFYPGQIISGRVVVCVDSPKKIRGIDIKFKGQAFVKWNDSESYRDSAGKEHSMVVPYTAKEQYFKNEYNLVGKGREFELTIGEHVYNFSQTLPFNVPSSYNGEYGGITYYIKSKMDIPWAVDKKIKVPFQVHSPLNLNADPQLKDPITDEDEKTFCCLCCASGPLVVKAYLPKTGFAFGQDIPLTVEINNSSNVAVSEVKCSLVQTIKWTVENPKYDSKSDNNKLATLSLGDAAQRSNRTWNETLKVPETVLPNLTQCGIIHMSYFIKVNVDPEGAHTDLDVKLPVQLGDIALYDGEYIPPQVTYPSTVPGYPNVTPTGPPYGNPAGGMPTSMYPQQGSVAQYPNTNPPLYPSMEQVTYPGYPQPAYPGAGQQPYPGAGQQPYPGAGQPTGSSTQQSPHPTMEQAPNPSAGQPPYPSTGQQQQPYPGAGQQQPYPVAEQQQPYPVAGQQQPYPVAGQQPYPVAGQQQPYPVAGQQPYPVAGQQPYPVAGQQQQPYSGAGQQQPYPSAGQTPYPTEGQPTNPSSGAAPSAPEI